MPPAVGGWNGLPQPLPRVAGSGHEVAEATTCRVLRHRAIHTQIWWAFLSQLDTVVREMRDPCVSGRADCCVLDTRARSRRGEPADRRWESGSRGFDVRTHGSDTPVCHWGHDHCVPAHRSDSQGSEG
jgi:hypothetical protein